MTSDKKQREPNQEEPSTIEVEDVYGIAREPGKPDQEAENRRLGSSLGYEAGRRARRPPRPKQD